MIDVKMVEKSMRKAHELKHDALNRPDNTQAYLRMRYNKILDIMNNVSGVEFNKLCNFTYEGNPTHGLTSLLHLVFDVCAETAFIIEDDLKVNETSGMTHFHAKAKNDN